MSKERISEIVIVMMDLEKKMRPMRWDLSRSQINEFRKKRLKEFEGEHANLKNELEELQKVL
jgi:hypothetical protein